MDIKLQAVLIGIVSGSVGYWFSTFSVQPVLRYRNIRNQVLIDFVYFAQVVNAEGLNDEMQKLYRKRILANRKSSAELNAAIVELPFWYRAFLKIKKLNPIQAARHLIGYSNTTDYEQSHKLENSIRKNLGLPLET